MKDKSIVVTAVLLLEGAVTYNLHAGTSVQRLDLDVDYSFLLHMIIN